MSNVFVFGKTCNDKKVDFNEEGEIKRLTESLLIYLCSIYVEEIQPLAIYLQLGTPPHTKI